LNGARYLEELRKVSEDVLSSRAIVVEASYPRLIDFQKA
jgi:hypothetical protein